MSLRVTFAAVTKIRPFRATSSLCDALWVTAGRDRLGVRWAGTAWTEWVAGTAREVGLRRRRCSVAGPTGTQAAPRQAARPPRRLRSPHDGPAAIAVSRPCRRLPDPTTTSTARRVLGPTSPPSPAPGRRSRRGAVQPGDAGPSPPITLKGETRHEHESSLTAVLCQRPYGNRSNTAHAAAKMAVRRSTPIAGDQQPPVVLYGPSTTS